MEKSTGGIRAESENTSGKTASYRQNNLTTKLLKSVQLGENPNKKPDAIIRL
jgi:hypothetical protein